MVNAVDLFALFGEIGGLNVRAAVPASHILDCAPMLVYLTNSTAGSTGNTISPSWATRCPPM